MKLPSERATEVVKARGETRGPASPIQLGTARLWSAYLRLPEISASDVSMMLILHKIAREKYGKSDPDNLTDIAGYANVYEMVKEELNGSSKASGSDGEVAGP